MEIRIQSKGYIHHGHGMTQPQSPPRTSYLIQCLNKPFEKQNCSEKEWLFKSFRFGGNSDLLGYFTKDFALEIGEICSFEGMGASEFEWGVVPLAFEAYRDNSDNPKWQYISFKMDIKNFSYPVYVICRKAHSRSVRARIKALAQTDSWAKLRKHVGLNPRERVGLHNSLCSLDQGGDPRRVGWIELTNGFFFFTDKYMWEGFLNLFKINSTRFIVGD